MATLKTSTIMSAFSPSKSEADIRATLDRYAKKGIGLFDLVNGGVNSSPAYAMLWGKHHKLLWTLMDEMKVDPLKPNPTQAKVPALLFAVSANNSEFIAEWVNRKLPLDNDNWVNAPLITALMSSSNEAVAELSRQGADWCKERTVKYRFAANRNDTPKVLTMKTVPWAIALVQGQTSNVKLAMGAKKLLTTEDFKYETPHQCWFMWNPNKKAENINLGTFFNHLLTRNSEIRNVYSTAYWKSLNSAGFIEAIKETPYGSEIDWEAIKTGNTELRGIFKAVVKKEDKILAKETQEILLELFVKNDRVSDVQAYASAARCKNLWSRNGLLADKPYHSTVALSLGRAKNLSNEDKNLPLFPLVVFRNLKNPAWWRAGAQDKKYNDQFWDFMAKATKKIYYGVDSGNWSCRTLPLMEFLPAEFALTERSLTGKKAAYKVLDIMYENADTQKVKDLFNSFLEIKPRVYNGEQTFSSFHMVIFAQPLDWAISKGLVSPKKVLDVINAAPNDVPQWSSSKLATWVNTLERNLLKEKVLEVTTENKTSRFDSAL